MLGVSGTTIALRGPVLNFLIVRSVVIPESEAEQSGIGHNHVKLTQDYGGGYPANVEGLHHLHCLVGLDGER